MRMGWGEGKIVFWGGFAGRRREGRKEGRGMGRIYTDVGMNDGLKGMGLLGFISLFFGLFSG